MLRQGWLAAAAVLLALLAAGLALGLLWFVRAAERAAALPATADGILVLTGGASRVDAGLHLLAAGRGRLLLISGVDRGIDLARLAHVSRLDPAPLAAHVTLGHAAASTRGNAAEAAAWVARHRLGSLIVVTAYYHMPRALLELRRAMPGVILYADPVVPPQLRGGGGAIGLRLLLGEYVKFLAVRSGLSRLLPSRDMIGTDSGGTEG